MNTNRCVIKGLKRCPECHSSNIYKRVRRTLEEQGARKGRQIIRKDNDNTNNKDNADDKDDKIKPYRCHKCKYEFYKPVII